MTEAAVLQALAVDDEPLALRRLSLVVDTIEGVEMVGTASDCHSARVAIERLRPDVVLLDIRMAGESGLDLASELAYDGAPAVVFVSALDRFAERAFDLAAADYVLKPAQPDRLRRAFERVEERRRRRETDDQIAELRAIVAALRSQDETTTAATEIWIRKNVTDLVRLPLEGVEWISAEGAYVRFHSGSRSYLHRSSIAALERQLDPRLFIRIHRATMVRIGAIAEVRRSAFGNTEVRLQNGETLHAGRIYAAALRKRLRAG